MFDLGSGLGLHSCGFVGSLSIAWHGGIRLRWKYEGSQGHVHVA